MESEKKKMAGKSTQLTLKVAAVNATSRVFRSIASSAVNVTKSIAKWGSVAAVATGGAFAATVNKLGTLSDVAQAAGATRCCLNGHKWVRARLAWKGSTTC